MRGVTLRLMCEFQFNIKFRVHHFLSSRRRCANVTAGRIRTKIQPTRQQWMPLNHWLTWWTHVVVVAILSVSTNTCKWLLIIVSWEIQLSSYIYFFQTHIKYPPPPPKKKNDHDNSQLSLSYYQSGTKPNLVAKIWLPTLVSFLWYTCM